MEPPKPGFLNDPLDKLDPDQNLRGNPALTWLIVYGAFQLFSKVLYAFLMPLFVSTGSSSQSEVKFAYESANNFSALGNIVIAGCILAFVKSTASRIVFIGILLLNIYALVLRYFTAATY